MKEETASLSVDDIYLPVWGYFWYQPDSSMDTENKESAKTKVGCQENHFT